MSVTHTTAKQQVVRKISPDRLADFDEQWWPITLLLLITAGGLAGYIYTNPNSDFLTQVWYRNAWVQIGSTGVVALFLLIGAALLRGSSQRRLQLGIFLSLVFHVSLLFWSRQYFLSASLSPVSDASLSLNEEVAVTIPDYIPAQAPDDKATELTRPADTEIRDEAKIEVTPKTPEQLKAEKESMVEPEPTREPKPTPIEMARVELSTPQRNDVLPKETLNRRELEEKLTTEAVPQQKPTAVAELKQSLAAESLEMARREAAAAPSRRVNAVDPRAADRLRPTVEPTSPTRRDMPDQTASADVAAALARRLTQTADSMPLAATEAAAARATQQAPLAGAMSPVQTMQRQAAASSAGQVAPTFSPAITLAPGSAAPAALSRAEAPEPSDSAPTTTPTNRPQRSSAGGAAAGMETVAVAVPTAPTSASAEVSGGASLEAVLTTTTRGDQGTPQQSLASNTSLPSPLGAGSGATAGSSSVGMRRADAAGDGTSGQATAAAAIGRPGRGRAVGSATEATNQLSGGALAAAVGPTMTQGNATSGTAVGMQPAISGSGSSLGERTVAQTGSGLRPSALGGTTGTASAAPSGGVAGGTGTASGLASGTRREIGDVGDIAGSATGTATTGLGARGKSSAAGNSAGLRTSEGMVAATGTTVASGATVGGTGLAEGMASLGQRTLSQTGNEQRPSALGGMTGSAVSPLPSGVAAGSSPRGSPAGKRRELGEVSGLTESANVGLRARTATDSPEALRDRHGNLKGSINDLIADGQMKGQKIIIVSFYLDEEIDESPLPAALSSKGYAVERINAPLPPLATFASKLDGTRQLWLFSSEANRLPPGHLKAILDRWRAGRLAVCLLADNAPFTAEALAVLNAIAPGTTITGSYLGEQKLKRRQEGSPGFDPSSPLFHNVETLFEGTTISSISGQWLRPVCYASNGLPLIATFELPGSSRLLLHCGFTSFYERFWDDAGVSRFALNVAGWLSEADRKNVLGVPSAGK